MPRPSPEDLVARCLALPAAVEEFPFGDEASVIKVGGKMFALVMLGSDPPSMNVKCDPALAVLLREQYPAVTPGYHMSKVHWNTVIVDGSIAGDLIDEWIEQSYDLVVASLTRKLRLQLGLERST